MAVVMNHNEGRVSADASDRTRRLGPGTELRALLRKRHWQTHSAFCREYDKAAARIDSEMVGHAPAKAQFYRWLTGEVKSLPFPDHCRVLEEMLPGYTVDELFAPATPLVSVQKTGQHLPRSDDRQQVVHSEPPEPSDSRDSGVGFRTSADVAGRNLRADHAGDSHESPDSVVGFVQPRDQREVTEAIDARVRSLMSWIGCDTAPIKERDIHRDNVRGPSVEAPARPAVDRRRSR
ncbi:hypothetical protein ACFXG4_49445 [Nocardia sp. NPDC059246]|uniref:hypothetical protein n=1 Tax=unclassified Nocardia TaxID=2637762 RepID=UPI0036B475C4